MKHAPKLFRGGLLRSTSSYNTDSPKAAYLEVESGRAQSEQMLEDALISRRDGSSFRSGARGLVARHHHRRCR